MGTAVLELPKGLSAPVEIGSLGAVFEAAPATEAQLGAKELELIRALTHALDTYLLQAISARSVAEFVEYRTEVWPKYVRALRALKDTFSNLVSEKVSEQIWNRVLPSLVSDIERRGVSVFGEKLTQQALFTLWTLGKIRILGREILAADVSEADRQKDAELCQEYHATSLWAQFHLDCLIAALRFNRPFAEEIREMVCDGLRAAVNAYAVMKDAVDLRHPAAEVGPILHLPWDEEDERLLASSMRDLNDRPSRD
jgi:hypothetical protein